MTGDLYINGNDAWATWKVAMGDDFLGNIMAPAGMKDLIENDSRLEDGKRVIYDNPKIDSREVTLTFNIHGATADEYLANHSAFVSVLQAGKVVVNVPAIGMTFTLSFKKSTSFALGRSRRSGKLSVKFEEPDPTLRD